MLTPIEEALLAIMMVVIMLGMGSSLTFKDFRIALRHPQAVLVGFASQYLFMPLIAFSLALAFNLTGPQTIGLVLMGCMPGGTTSNIFAYFSKSLLSLSIMMTVCSTIGAVFLVPILMEVYTAGVEGHLRIPPAEIIGLLFVLLIPTFFGMWLRKRNPNKGALSELTGSLVGVVVIIFLVVTWIPRNYQLLLDTAPGVFASVILLGLIGFAFGYGFARLLRLDPRKARTVSLETGIQNGPLGALIVIMVFSGSTQQEVLVMPVLYSLFIVMTSTVATLYYRRWTRLEELARDQAKVEPAG
ncbi:MAG: transporter [Halomonadaceae bacterium]|nr:MAG: transporter [Halomonadaceae bacterium]